MVITAMARALEHIMNRIISELTQSLPKKLGEQFNVWPD